MSLTASNGEFTQTTYSGSTISLGPASVVDPFPGDTGYWQVIGAAWTANGDKLTMNNTNSGNNYLEAINAIQQSTAEAVTFRVKAYGSNIESGLGNNFGVQLILTDSGGLGGTQLGSATANFPPGTFSEQQFNISVSPVLPAPGAPALTASASGGSLATGSVYVKVTAKNANGETVASQESSVAATGPSGSVAVAITAVTGATSYNVYASSSTGTEELSGNTTSTSYTITSLPASGSASPPSTNTASQAAYYLYAYIFARSGTGEVTVWDAEIFQANGTAAVYGKWSSNSVDLWQTANQAISETGLSLSQYGFYYGDLSNVDNANSVDHSVEVLSQFPRLVCNEPGLNTTSRQQYVQQQLVSAGVKLFGYVNVGVGETKYNNCIPPITDITAAIDRCASNGYAGVFLDADGGGIPTDQNNYIYDYIHNKGLAVFANAHPQDVFISQSNTTLTAPTSAPSASAVADAGSTLSAGTYNVGYTFTNYDGETTVSPTTSVTIASGQGIQVGPVTVGNYTMGVNFYISQTAGGSTLGLASRGYGAQTTVGAPSSATQPPSTNTAYTGNHSGASCHLTRGDTCLWESFYSRSDNQYAGVPEGGFVNVFTQYQTGAQKAAQNGVGLCGLAYALSGTSPSNFTDWINAYVLAVGLGFTGLAFGSDSSNNVVEWVTPPTFPNLGSRITTSMEQTSPTTYDAYSDAGVIRFTAVDSPVSRSYSAFASGGPYAVSVTSSPTASATKTSTTYEQSTDGNTWSDASLGNVTDRYFRQILELHS